MTQTRPNYSIDYQISNPLLFNVRFSSSGVRTDSSPVQTVLRRPGESYDPVSTTQQSYMRLARLIGWIYRSVRSDELSKKSWLLNPLLIEGKYILSPISIVLKSRRCRISTLFWIGDRKGTIGSQRRPFYSLNSSIHLCLSKIQLNHCIR